MPQGARNGHILATASTFSLPNADVHADLTLGSVLVGRLLLQQKRLTAAGERL